MENKSSGIGFFGLLTILFIGLKLTGYIDWNWWIVLSPVILPVSIGIIIVTWMLYRFWRKTQE